MKCGNFMKAQQKDKVCAIIKSFSKDCAHDLWSAIQMSSLSEGNYII